MSDYFKCKLCDKSINIKSKKKPLNSQCHKSLSMCIISRYIVKNPDFIHIDNILTNYLHFIVLYVNGNYSFWILSLVLYLTPGIVFLLVTIYENFYYQKLNISRIWT